MDVKEQYKILFNERLSIVQRMAKKYSDVITDKQFLDNVEQKQVAFKSMLDKVYKNKIIFITSFKNSLGNIKYSYTPASQVENDLRIKANHLSTNSIIINCSEKIMNRVDMTESKRLPTVPSSVCAKIGNDANRFIMGVNASKINKILGTNFKVVNFDDYYEKSGHIAKAKKLTIADAAIFEGGKSYNDLKNSNYYMVIQTGKRYYNEKGYLIADQANGNRPIDACLAVDDSYKAAFITMGQFKRLEKVWKNEELPIWNKWLASKVNQQSLQQMYDENLSQSLIGATGIFGSYIRAEYEIVKRLSNQMTFTQKQKEFMKDLKFAVDFNSNIRRPKVNIDTVRQIAIFTHTAIDTSKKQIFVGPDYNAKYPFKDIVYSYNNDNEDQVKKYLHLVEVW